MTANKSPHFRKVIAILTVVMAFFIFSCEKRVILKEPVSKKPPLKKPPEKKVVIDHFAMAEGYWDQKEYDKALAAYERYLKAFQ